MADEANEPDTRPMDTEERELSDRRDFLRSMGKWSTAAIAAILLSEPAPSHAASGRVNSRGSWITRGGSGINRGGVGWLNSRGGGGSWVNRRGW
jgi:hypothetical protein